MQLAVDWIIGEAGEMDEQRENAEIVRVVIAGNSLSENTKDKAQMAKAKYLTKDTQASSIEAVKVLDNLLVQLAGSVDTDLMPGAFDPANQILPQQPLHPCLFPLASVYPTFKSVTNPYMSSIDGLNLTGTSGQNVEDLLSNTTLDDALDAIECTLRWSHLAPTCPDTLGCFPYVDKDPFITNSRPHVTFAGNQEFGQRWFKQDGQSVKMISLPKFSVTSSFVVLNLKTLEAEEISFDGLME
jgi:DNA polymerase delta subunit 2